jgi:hypothetical protein
MIFREKVSTGFKKIHRKDENDKPEGGGSSGSQPLLSCRSGIIFVFSNIIKIPIQEKLFLTDRKKQESTYG